MADWLSAFEAIARRAHQFTEAEPGSPVLLHPFDSRNIHPCLPSKVRNLFDDGHFSEATFTAYKFLDKVVQKHSKLAQSGFKLMNAALDLGSGPVRLTASTTQSEKDEQDGYRWLFAGTVMAIRNPRAHEVEMQDDIDTCLDHLAFASHLLRRLEQAGYMTV